jgi:hypothetical protein
MEIPQTREEIKEVIDKLDWDFCDVRLEVVKKTHFGLLREDFETEEKWVARFCGQTYFPDRAPHICSVFDERPFTVDTRLGENYTERMTQAFEDIMGDLFEQGWELEEDADPYTKPIYLKRPPDWQPEVKKKSRR